MSTNVGWPGHAIGSSGYFVQGTGDVITVSCQAAPKINGPGGIQRVGLVTPPNIRWGKKLRLLDAQGNEISTIETINDDHGPYWMDAPADFSLPSGACQLEFCKAMTFGVMTGVYVIPYRLTVSTGPNPPYQFLFTWEQD